MIFYARENIVKLAIMLIGVICAIRCEGRNVHLVRESEEAKIHVLFAAKIMSLQLDVQTFFENVIQPREIRLTAAVSYAFVHEPVGTAGEAKKIGGVLFDILPSREVLAFVIAKLDRR